MSFLNTTASDVVGTAAFFTPEHNRLYDQGRDQEAEALQSHVSIRLNPDSGLVDTTMLTFDTPQGTFTLGIPRDTMRNIVFAAF